MPGLTLPVIAILVVAAVVAAIFGYWLGARSGTSDRERLEQTLRHRDDELRRSRLETRAVLQAEKSERIRSTLDLAATKDVAETPASAEPSAREVDALAAQVREVMGPLAALAKMQAALTQVPDTFTHRGHLEALLEEVVSRASLTYVVLSDEAGLPLAASHADSPEAVAASASVVLTLADRMRDTRQPEAVGAVVHDAQSRRIVHRIFSTGRERYVMTAVCEGLTLGPDALDPVLPRIRRLLEHPGPISDVA